jgi:molybdenum cofactor cytidylyltransferase
MAEGVIIAAGLSSRADGWKMAFDIGGKTIIERCILGMIPYCTRIFIVGGNHFNALLELLPKLKYPTVELIYNPDYQNGMFSSVLTGFRQVCAPKFFFIPGDYPLVSGNVYKTMLTREGEIIIPSYQGISGHPVLFRTNAVRDLFTISNKYTNLRQFVISHNYITVEVTDPGIIVDIDTREDYRRAIRYFESGPSKTDGFYFNQ